MFALYRQCTTIDSLPHTAGTWRLNLLSVCTKANAKDEGPPHLKADELANMQMFHKEHCAVTCNKDLQGFSSSAH